MTAASMPTWRLCVYCGSRLGAVSSYRDAAADVGRWIGRSGGQLIYGGGKAGLMGVVADAALEAGASVVGVIPASLMDRELGHQGLTELHVVGTMHERKRLMAERADAFLALPGGIGTFEELFEVWTWRQLGYHDKPLGLLNVAGYYDPLLSFLDGAVSTGFLPPGQRALVQVDTTSDTLLTKLKLAALRASAPDDYSEI